MPNTKCGSPSGPQLRLALQNALNYKGYTPLTLVDLSKLLGISITDALAVCKGRRPSIDAVRAIHFFIANALALPKPWVIPAQPVVNFCPREVVYATRI